MSIKQFLMQYKNNIIKINNFIGFINYCNDEYISLDVEHKGIYKIHYKDIKEFKVLR